jgi:hypothetical protein
LADQGQLKFRHFLQAFPELVEVISVGKVDKVKLAVSKPSKHITETTVETQTTTGSVSLAYLIVDSPSFLDNLHHILTGEKLNPKTLPNWDQLRKYLQGEFPAKEWRARFFMGIASAQSDGADGFRGYLEAVGFRVIQLKLQNEPSVMDEMVNERARVTALAVSKLLCEIGNNVKDANVFIVTHSGSVAGPLSDLLKNRQGFAQIGVIGFPERMDSQLIKLKENGLTVIDIETDAKVFKGALPRRQLISPNEFDAAQYL